MKMLRGWVVGALFSGLTAQAIEVAEQLVVDLDAAKLPLADGAYVQHWTNNAAAGGVFTNEIEAVASWLKPRKPAAP